MLADKPVGIAVGPLRQRDIVDPPATLRGFEIVFVEVYLKIGLIEKIWDQFTNV
jgi:hypothetical protein